MLEIVANCYCYYVGVLGALLLNSDQYSD